VLIQRVARDRDWFPGCGFKFPIAASRDQHLGARTMKEYRAYVIGPNGHIARRIDLYCADEETAKERAKQLADREPIELWHGDQCIARFRPTQAHL
jgi:hypothetical protein